MLHPHPLSLDIDSKQTVTSVGNIPREVAVDIPSHLSGKADPLELALGHALLPLGVCGQLVLRRDPQRVVPACRLTCLIAARTAACTP